MKRLLVISLLTVLVLGCKRLPPDTPVLFGNDPVFHMSGTVDGEDFGLYAGADEFYMWTKADVENGVQTFSGELTDQSNGLSIKLYDSQSGLLEALGSIPAQSYDFANLLQNMAGLLYIDTSAVSDVDFIEWYVDGHIVSDWTDIFNLQPGIYEVCAKVTFMGGCTEEICDQVFLGFQDGCPIEFSATVNGNSLTLSPLAGGQAQNYTWLIDGDVYNGHTVTVNSQSPVVEVCLQAEFIDGCNASICKNVKMDTTSCFFESFQYTPSSGQDLFNTIVVEWTEDGQTYSSAVAEQNQSSSFVITDVTPYLENESGQHTLKLDVKFSCLVRNPNTGDIKFLENINGSFGFALPN